MLAVRGELGIIPENHILLLDAFNHLGKMLFKEHWTGKECRLSQTLPIGVRKLFYSNLHYFPRRPEALVQWSETGLGCDRSTLSEAITIGMLEGEYIVSEEQYQKWVRQSLDIALQGKEHIIFLTDNIHSINPEYGEKTFKAYQRYFYVETLLRKAVVNGNITAMNRDTKTGKIQPCEPEIWGADNFFLNVEESTIIGEHTSDDKNCQVLLGKDRIESLVEPNVYEPIKVILPNSKIAIVNSLP